METLQEPFLMEPETAQSQVAKVSDESLSLSTLTEPSPNETLAKCFSFRRKAVDIVSNSLRSYLRDPSFSEPIFSQK